jgi:hypothetical protein
MLSRLEPQRQPRYSNDIQGDRPEGRRVMSPVTLPVHTSAFIVALMVATGIGTWLLLSFGLRRTSIAPATARRWRWALGLGLTTWLGARLALASRPPGSELLATPYSFLSFAFLLVGLTAGLLLLAAPSFRSVIRTAPIRWLVGLHAIRIGGFAWLALADMHLLPAGFAVPAGYGDMSVGVSALVVVLLLVRRHPRARAAVIAWSILGLADFVVAVTAAFLAMPAFVDQLVAAGAPLAYLNYPFLIPSFGVPLFGLLHVYALIHVWSAGTRSDRSPDRAVVVSQP